MSKSGQFTARLVGSLGAAASIAAGTCGYADIVYFRNPDPDDPNHFDWRMGALDERNTWLDLTRPSTRQPGMRTPTSVSQYFHLTSYGHEENYPTNSHRGGAEVSNGQFKIVPVELGVEIGPDLPNWGWYDSGLIAIQWGKDWVYTSFSYSHRQYLAVRFTDGEGLKHYGWVSVTRRGEFSIELEAFGWAYESIPGKPIIAGATPAPGTLALLAFGAAFSRGRKRGGRFDRPV